MRTPTTVARITGVAAVAALGIMIPISAAGAAPYPAGGTPPEVSPNTASTAVAGTTTAVAGKTVARSTLPFTGTDVVELTAIAGVSAGIGLVMVRRSRRTSTS
jgi:hypothetical protein